MVIGHGSQQISNAEFIIWISQSIHYLPKLVYMGLLGFFFTSMMGKQKVACKNIFLGKSFIL